MNTQLDFGFAPAAIAPAAIGWKRYPVAFANKAHYALQLHGIASGIEVRWCGHPTAIRPYYVIDAAGWILDRKFPTVAAAKAAALELAWKN